MVFKHKKIHIPKREYFIDETNEFLNFPETDIEIEHSLVSISVWEAKYHKPFLSTQKTQEETLDYIKMMVIGELPDDSDIFFSTLPKNIVDEIKEYIDNPMTATVFSEEEEKKTKGTSSNEFVTAETIYYWMTAQNIPFDCEMWHINKLVALIKMCALKNQPDDKKKKKMTSSDLALRRAKMEAARAKYNKH